MHFRPRLSIHIIKNSHRYGSLGDGVPFNQLSRPGPCYRMTRLPNPNATQSFKDGVSDAGSRPPRKEIFFRCQHRIDHCGLRSPGDGTNQRLEPIWMPRVLTASFASGNKGPRQDRSRGRELHRSGQSGPCPLERRNGNRLHSYRIQRATPTGPVDR